MRGGVFARCCRIFRANLRHFTQGSFASGFQIRLTPGEGDGKKDEFRILGGGFQGIREFELKFECPSGPGVLLFLGGGGGWRNWVHYGFEGIDWAMVNSGRGLYMNRSIGGRFSCKEDRPGV